MNWRENMQVESVWNWLKIATEGLSTQSEARITAEIEAHYNQSVSEYVAKGRPRSDAEILALEQLGDPKVARKSFRKKHLTEIELKKISNSVNSNRNKWLVVLVYLGIIGVSVFFALTQHSMNSYLSLTIICFAALVFLPRILYNLVKHRENKQYILNILLLDAVEEVIIGCLLLLLFLWIVSCYNIIPWVSILPNVLRAVATLRLWKKVRRTGGTEFNTLRSA